jgi:hypothetical protein
MDALPAGAKDGASSVAADVVNACLLLECEIALAWPRVPADVRVRLLDARASIDRSLARTPSAAAARGTDALTADVAELTLGVTGKSPFAEASAERIDSGGVAAAPALVDLGQGDGRRTYVPCARCGRCVALEPGRICNRCALKGRDGP